MMFDFVIYDLTESQTDHVAGYNRRECIIFILSLMFPTHTDCEPLMSLPIKAGNSFSLNLVFF